MARNRKRTNQRRARRPASVATVRGPRDDAREAGAVRDDAPERQEARDEAPELQGVGGDAPEFDDLRDDIPVPLAHAAPDVELAEAQLALGRGEPVDDFDEDGGIGANGAAVDELEPQSELNTNGAAVAVNGELAASGSEWVNPRAGTSASALPATFTAPSNRLLNFLQGSWHELQRVQWPDRRQVIQATGVVIGFVIIAGVFLGLADLVSTHLVNLVLK